ncbi:HTH domain-containing protein [Fusobacterium russii]|uniref:HTH domain-containing protein n=1 Tax=Fusobacterium russii TaxID=854 RepID=UPI0003A1FC15|nr:HTH domain-containing protein [Fusobacterium russii]
MIKIAIFTPQNSYIAIERALRDVDCIKEYIYYDNLYTLGEIYKKIAHKYHGIITSGPIGYQNIKKQVKITTPVYYLEISKSDLFKYLFETLKENPNIDFSRVYIDFISNNDKEYWLENIFSEKEEPIFLPLDYSSPKLYENLKKNYLYLKKEKKIDYVLTRISNMLPFLEENKIPYKFLFPSENAIKETVLSAINDIKAKKFDKNQIVFGKLKGIKNLKELESSIHNSCKNCILQKNKEELNILLLKEDFLEMNINSLIKEKYKKNFFIGWGNGKNLNEARFFAEEALKKNIESNGEIICMMSPKKTKVLGDMDGIKKENLCIIEKLKKLNISTEKARSLIEIYRNDENISSEELGRYLNISSRTASRILEKLEKNSLAIFSIEKIKRGRPKKIYNLNF